MSGWKPSSSLTITKDFALFVTNPLKIYTDLHFQNSIFQKTRHPFRTEKQKLRKKWAKTTFYFGFSYYIMMPGSKGLSPHELAHMWVKDLRTRPDMSIKMGRKHHDMRIAGRIVGVRSTKQSVGIKVGGF